jgi:rod shape determining protein RodA
MADFIRSFRDSSGKQQKRGLWQRIHIDPWLLLLICITFAAGSVVLYSASDGNYSYLIRQFAFASIGLIAMVVVAQFPPGFMARWAWLAYLGGLLLLVGVIFIGTGAKGAQRWLDIAGIRFQPSEITKLALPMMIAAYLAKRALPPRFKHIFWSLVIIAIPTVLVLRQPDLGTSLLVAAAGIFVLFLAGLGWRYIAAAVGLFLISVPLAWNYLLHDYQKTRVLTLLDPEADKLGAGWNIIQSKTAIGSGGFSGKGWLEGTQSHLDFLPESHTDFIIAVLAEEFGLTGVLILMTLYLLIVARGLWISATAASTFGRLVAGALSMTFFVYIFVNMGMVSGILPVVGVPLPLVSYGGTSLVTLFLSFGILMSVATEEAPLHS